jgi:c-di-GMP-binding flagellar brake protein YcgR
LGCQRGGSLRTLRRQWQKWSADPAGLPAEALPPFSLQALSVGGGGLGLGLPAPVKSGECLLVFLALDDDQPLVVALGEVVWVGPARADGLLNSGLHFLNLLDRDRQRIELYVRRQLLAQKAADQGS